MAQIQTEPDSMQQLTEEYITNHLETSLARSFNLTLTKLSGFLSLSTSDILGALCILGH